MQKKCTQNKDFRTVWSYNCVTVFRVAMQKSKPLSELMAIPSRALKDLSARLAARSQVLDEVRAALPAKLAVHVVSAGIDEGRLTIGVRGGVWASRLRYLSAGLRKSIGKAMAVNILTVRIRVVPPPDQIPERSLANSGK
jgi:hypothetical protein